MALGPWVACDFDHTIRDVKHGEYDRPMEGAKDAISRLREKGYRVMIHSCNNPKFIEQWMNNHDIRFDGIWTEKPVAAYYIDDHGIKFTTWKEVMEQING